MNLGKRLFLQFCHFKLDNTDMLQFSDMSDNILQINSSVKDNKKEKEVSISRNSLCLCGSGKRYKHCCGKK